jgi:MFS family permease
VQSWVSMEEARLPAPAGGARDPDARQLIPPLLAGYWAFGQYWGVWVILVADLNAHHGLTYGENGLQLTLLSVVAVFVMAVVTPRLARFALGTTVPVSLMSLGVGAIAMAMLPTGSLWVAFVLVGIGNGLIDVYLNVEAQRVEVATRRPVLQWLHASYAVGGVTGAAVGGLIDSLDVDFRVGIIFTGLVLFVTAFWNAHRGPREVESSAEGTLFSLSAFRRHRTLWVAALVVLFAFLVEGSMDVWSGLYLREELGATAAIAALAFAAFSGALCLGRLFASRVLFGMGPRATILLAGVGAAAGGAIAALTSSPAVVGAAFLLMGFAISAAAPAGFGLVESAAPGDQANAIAAVTTIGYSGFVWSPPIFGWIAQTVDLRAAMLVIISSTIGIVVAGLIAPRRLNPVER